MDLLRWCLVIGFISSICASNSPYASVTFSDQVSNYYGDLPSKNLTGQALKTALNQLISSNVKVLSYDQIWKAFDATDEYTNQLDCTADQIEDIYSAKCWTDAQECGNYPQEGDCFNREHFWPKSWWSGSKIPSYTDIHHIFPADGYVNNQRSNMPLGTVSRSSITFNSTNGCLIGACENKTGLTCFEPTDKFKGHAARVYFYMSTRYENVFTCCDEPGVNNADIKPWMETVLREWNRSFPVGVTEKTRNDKIFAIQQNRNPFTDYPHWVEDISNF